VDYREHLLFSRAGVAQSKIFVPAATTAPAGAEGESLAQDARDNGFLDQYYNRSR